MNAKKLTETQITRLQKLNAALEDAPNFTKSSNALAALNRYEEKLITSGYSIDDICAATGR